MSTLASVLLMSSHMYARLFLLGLAASVVVACSAAPDPPSKPLSPCEAKGTNCPGAGSSTPKQPRSEDPSEPLGTPTEEPLTPNLQPAGDAGVDAAPAVGKDCQGLAACCLQLGQNGYDTTKCKSVLSTNNEDACYTQHASYKQFGDCS